MPDYIQNHTLCKTCASAFVVKCALSKMNNVVIKRWSTEETKLKKVLNRDPFKEVFGVMNTSSGPRYLWNKLKAVSQTPLLKGKNPTGKSCCNPSTFPF